MCLSVPSIVNRGGVETALDVPITTPKLAGLRNSAERIREAIRSVGF